MINEDCSSSIIGVQIKGYTILRQLGSGGSAHVYLAQNELGDRVAVKLLDSSHCHLEFQQQMLQEIQFLQALKSHPHILSLFDSGESGGIPYLLLEYAPGGTLRERLQVSPPVKIEQALTILVQIGKALHAAHQQNIIHNDLKPENILFNRKNEAILADFGIAVRLKAKAEFHGSPRGTYAYMAPEQFDGMFTKEGDQYALGCLAYELLTGKHPFEHPFPFEPGNHEIMRKRHKNAQPRRLRLLNKAAPDHIERAILQALAKKPSERHADVSTFIQSLQLTDSFLFQTSSHVVHTLYTPPYLPIQGETRHPFPPPENADPLPISVEACEVVQPQENPLRIVQKLDLPQPIVPAFHKKKDKEVIKNTDYSLPLTPRPAKISRKTAPPKTKVHITAPPKTKDPVKERNLCLPNELLKLLSSPLRSIGLVLSQVAIVEPIKVERWQYSTIKSITQQHLALIYIPRRYLHAGTDRNIETVRTILSLFPHATLIIFSDLTKFPAPPIGRLLDKHKKENKNSKIRIISEQYIDELKEMKGSDLQKHWIIEHLEIGDLLQEPTRVSDADIGILEGILEDYLPKYGIDIRSELSLIELGKITSNISIQVPGDIRKIINHLNISPLQIHAGTGHTFLGLMLCHFLKKDNFPRAGLKAVKTIIRRYKLGPSSCSCRK